jgi:hypothetical protein
MLKAIKPAGKFEICASHPRPGSWANVRFRSTRDFFNTLGAEGTLCDCQGACAQPDVHCMCKCPVGQCPHAAAYRELFIADAIYYLTVAERQALGASLLPNQVVYWAAHCFPEDFTGEYIQAFNVVSRGGNVVMTSVEDHLNQPCTYSHKNFVVPQSGVLDTLADGSTLRIVVDFSLGKYNVGRMLHVPKMDEEVNVVPASLSLDGGLASEVVVVDTTSLRPQVPAVVREVHTLAIPREAIADLSEQIGTFAGFSGSIPESTKTIQLWGTIHRFDKWSKVPSDRWQSWSGEAARLALQNYRMNISRSTGGWYSRFKTFAFRHLWQQQKDVWDWVEARVHDPKMVVVVVLTLYLLRKRLRPLSLFPSKMSSFLEDIVVHVFLPWWIIPSIEFVGDLLLGNPLMACCRHLLHFGLSLLPIGVAMPLHFVFNYVVDHLNCKQPKLGLSAPSFAVLRSYRPTSALESISSGYASFRLLQSASSATSRVWARSSDVYHTCTDLVNTTCNRRFFKELPARCPPLKRLLWNDSLTSLSGWCRDSLGVLSRGFRIGASTCKVRSPLCAGESS